jgi:hypothetical protein
MSDDKKQGAKPDKSKSQGGGDVLILKCACDGCTTRPTRAQFCDSHYLWFKEGLITKEGHKAKDYDKKYQHFMRRSAKAA